MGVVDGELIALTESDGVQELKQQDNKKKEEIKQAKEQEKAQYVFDNLQQRVQRYPTMRVSATSGENSFSRTTTTRKL